MNCVNVLFVADITQLCVKTIQPIFIFMYNVNVAMHALLANMMRRVLRAIGIGGEMAKLITAERALALSVSTYSIETAIERINEEIECQAKQGKYEAVVKMAEPELVVDSVVTELLDAGYNVHYSTMNSEFVVLKIRWV